MCGGAAIAMMAVRGELHLACRLEAELLSTVTDLRNRPSDHDSVELMPTLSRGKGETAVVRAEHLSKCFGDLRAVDDLTFSLERGTVTGFLGPNGAGKTTTLRMLLHLVEPSAGRALVFGRSYQDLERPAAQVGAVLEAADFHPGRSGRDHLFALALALGSGSDGGRRSRDRERTAATRVDSVLDLVELRSASRRRVGSYSLGMRQRLGLAAALLGDPAVLILDEPANGLDPEGVRWLRDFLRHFAADGKTVLVSSHVLAEVAQTVDDVIIINNGRLVTISPLAELIERRTGAVRVRVRDAHTLRAELETEGLRATLLDGGELLVEGAPSARIGDIAFRAGIPLEELVSESSSLEDVFLELTAEAPS
jgi:ABC-2 type transport system ATP-binding protein